MDELIARLRAVSETGCDPDLPHEAADAIVAMVRRAEDAEQLATARGHTIRSLQQQLSAVKVDRDAMAAKLKELEGQEPALYVQSNHVTNAKFGPFLSRACAQPMDGIAATEFFARPVPAEPVNARLAEMANQCRLDLVAQLHEIADHIERIQYCIRDEDARKQIVGQMRYAIGVSSKWNQNGNPFIAAAEAQQAEPVRLTDEEIEAVEEIQRKSSVPSFFLVNPVMFARRVEAAVLRKQGYKVEG